MYRVRATQKLRTRLGAASAGDDEAVEATTVLGDWCATALLRKPQIAPFV